MSDPTEATRKILLEAINSDPSTEEDFKRLKIPYWTTDMVREQFEVLGFMAPLVVVKRKSDGVVGTLVFQHHPRIYYSFEEDKK